MKIFVITLHDPIRKRSVEDQLRGCEFEYIAAVQTKLVDSIKASKFDYEKYRQHDQNFLPDNAVGCVLSHNLVYQKIINDELKGALILEDDFVTNFSSGELRQLISDLEHREVDLCVLGYSKMNGFDIFNYNLSNPFFTREECNSKFEVCKRVFHTTCGAVGYYISNSAAKKIIGGGTPYYVADEWPIIASLGVEISYISPHVFNENQSFESTIEEQRSAKNKTAPVTTLSLLINVTKMPFRYVKGLRKKCQKR